jgi:hypothetical protein
VTIPVMLLLKAAKLMMMMMSGEGEVAVMNDIVL